MRFFIDTEFIEGGPKKPIQLISIGIVSEAGHEYYAISSEFNPDDASPWVRDNVLSKLEPESVVPRKPLEHIAVEIEDFVLCRGGDGKPEFWGYFSDYDWVVFCQIFGSMINLPANFPMYCLDIKQLAFTLGNPQLREQTTVEHNALNDARWNRTAWRFLRHKEYRRTQDLLGKLTDPY
jgi:hypothetical protein